MGTETGKSNSDEYRQRVRRMRHAIAAAVASMEACKEHAHHHKVKRLLIDALRRDKALARLHKLEGVKSGD